MLGSDLESGVVFQNYWDNPENPTDPSGRTGDLIPATWGDRLDTVTAAFGGIERVAYLAMAGFGLYLLFGMSQGKGRRRR